MMGISINLAEDIYPLSELESQAKQLINKVQTTKRSLIFTEGGRSVVALLDIGEFQSLREQLTLMLDLLDISRAEQDEFTSHEVVKSRYAWLWEGAPDANTTD